MEKDEFAITTSGRATTPSPSMSFRNFSRQTEPPAWTRASFAYPLAESRHRRAAVSYTHLVSVGGYLISSPAGNQTPWPPEPAFLFWYQYYFSTPVGKAGYAKYTDQFNKFIWHQASPKWNFDDATYDRTAASFNNPDHVDIVMHDYRWRLGLADGERKYDDLEKRLAALPPITVPTITLEGDANGAIHAPSTAYRNKFSGKYEYLSLIHI